MATTKKTEAAPVQGANMVPCKPARNPGGDENLFVSVNDTAYILKRGVTTMVPDFIAAEVERMEAAQDKFYGTVEALTATE